MKCFCYIPVLHIECHSQLNPVQPGSFSLVSFFMMQFWDCIHISQLLAEEGAKYSALSAAAAHLFVMLAFTCSEMFHYTPELSEVLWITTLLCWVTAAILHWLLVSMQKFQRDNCRLLFPAVLSKTQRNPDGNHVKPSDQQVWRNNHATLTVNPLSSRFSPKCF